MMLQDNRDPHSAKARFFITLDRAPWLDKRYTIVGQILEGLETLDRMLEVPLDGNKPVEPIVIERVEITGG